MADRVKLYVVCGSTDEQANEWRVFAFAEGGLKARLFGKDRRAELLAPLFAAVKKALEAEPGVRNLVQDD